jgi:hypothetical protein
VLARRALSRREFLALVAALHLPENVLDGIPNDVGAMTVAELLDD